MKNIRMRLRMLSSCPVTGKPRLRPVLVESKLEKAIKWLRERNLYILDSGSKRPGWGIPGTMKGIK